MKLEVEIKKLQERNKSVEVDKAWEVSFTRRLLLVVFTYLSVGVYLAIIQIPKPWLNAIVPAVAFMLSTLTLPWFKRKWVGK
jgi:hypothetical protein